MHSMRPHLFPSETNSVSYNRLWYGTVTKQVELSSPLAQNFHQAVHKSREMNQGAHFSVSKENSKRGPRLKDIQCESWHPFLIAKEASHNGMFGEVSWRSHFY